MGLAKLICNHTKLVSKTDNNCHSSRTDFLNPLTHVNTPRLVVRMLVGWHKWESIMSKTSDEHLEIGCGSIVLGVLSCIGVLGYQSYLY